MSTVGIEIDEFYSHVILSVLLDLIMLISWADDAFMYTTMMHCY